MANNLKDHLKEVADAIRAKKGTSDLINPQDFSKEIASIEGGGSGGGESNIEYLDVNGMGYDAEPMIIVSQSTKVITMEDRVCIAPTVFSQIQLKGNIKTTLALSINFSDMIDITIGSDRFNGTLLDFMSLNGITQEQLDAIPRLTKEQFYDLNA